MSLLLYDIILAFYGLLLRIAAWAHPKARLFVRGRRGLLDKITQKREAEHRPVIWIHCASLGEFEQGRPVIEAIKTSYPQYAVWLTFFSPSGYEVKKDYAFADGVFYLPLDTRQHAAAFTRIVRPVLALFVKYEFWFHYLNALRRLGVPAVLFSAYFQPDQPFFKWYGRLYRRMLGCYQQVFVQDEASEKLLNGIHIKQVQVAGDTRFDRCAKVVATPEIFPAVACFKADKQLLIAGSSWPEDDALLQQVLPLLQGSYKLLVAPHETDKKNTERLLDYFGPAACLWDADTDILESSQVAIVNTVGQLSFLYRYADAVWIGGGFGAGIHNIIEPAVYGIPVFFGPNFKRFREAREMIREDAAASVTTASALVEMLRDTERLSLIGDNAREYVARQLGATRKIMDYLEEKCFSSRL